MERPRPSFAIRRAHRGDAEGICRMHIDSIRVNCASDYTPAQIEAWAGPKQPQDYVEGMARGEVMFVAESDGQIVGFAALAGQEMRALYVAPRMLHQGIGSRLLREIESKATREGLESIHLNSTITAMKFYEAHGYVRGAPTVHCMKGVNINCIAMRKSFKQS